MCIKLIFLANREEPFFVWKIKIKWSSSRVVNLEPSRRHHLMNLFIYPSSFFHSNPNYGSSSALANANAYNQQFGPNGFGASAANAGAQAFQAQGPLGGFGASASNAQSQGFQAGPNGITVRYLKTFNWYITLTIFLILNIQGSAGLSGGQSYNLPNGQTLSLTYANGVSIGADGRPTVSKGNSIAFS